MYMYIILDILDILNILF